MTATTTAATATADPSATTATTTATATDATTPPGSDGKTAEAETTTGADAGGEGGDATATAAADGVPEAYEFTLAEGVTLDQAALDRFTPAFKEMGLKQDQAQKLVDLYTEHVKSLGEGASEQAEQWYAERRAGEIAAANEAGITAIKADREIGGAQFDQVKARIDAALGAVGTPELRAKFDTLGIGNDPDVVRLIHRLIDYVPEDTGTGQQANGGGATQANPAAILYPNEARR